MQNRPPEELRALLESVRLTLEESDGGWIVGYDKERHPVPALPLDDLDPEARRAELIAVAAGIEAAVKYPGRTVDQPFVEGGGALLPRIERRSYVDAYTAVLRGRDAAEGEQIHARDFGAGLSVVYVRDEGWRFEPVTRDQVERWGISPGTVDAGARSNLYHRAEVPWDVAEVHLGDGYDAARAVLTSDVFYQLGDASGIPIAIPDRDHLLVGDGATAEATTRAYEGAAYPLCPRPLIFLRGAVTVR
ncbi:MAG: hypothetical protein ACQEXJ_05915 [Myxococcota bacterium]